MNNDYNIVLEIKNGNNKRKDFFYSKLIEKIRKLQLKDEDKIAEEVFNEALNTYTENTPIHFLFHMQSILHKKTDNDYTKQFTEIETEIINLYLNESEGKYLSISKIAKKLEVPIKKVDETKEKFKKLKIKNNEYLITTFGDYDQKLEKRKTYFYNLNKINERQIEIIGYYTGKLDEALSIDKLAKKYHMSYHEMKNEILEIFRLLKYEKNQEIILEVYPKIVKELREKATVLNLKINFEYFKIKENQKYNVKASPQFQEKKNQKRKNSKVSLTPKEIKILYALKQKEDDNLSEAQLKILLNVSESTTLTYKIKNIIKKLDLNPELKRKALDIYPNLLTLNAITTNREREIIETTIKQEKENLTDEEIKVILNYKTINDLHIHIERVFRKVLNNEEYKEEITKLYPELLSLKSFQNYQKTENEYNIKLNGNAICRILNLIITNPQTPYIIKKEALDVHKKITSRNIKTLPSTIRNTVAIINGNLTDDLPYEKLLNNTKYRNFEELVNDFYAKIYNPNDSSFQKAVIKEADIIITRDLYTPTPKGYYTQSDLAHKYDITNSSLYDIKESVLESIKKGLYLERIEKIWPTYKEDIIIKENFNKSQSVKLDHKEESALKTINLKPSKYDKIAKGIINLEESIYGEYASNISYYDQLTLAFRFGFYNNHPYLAPEISEILNRSEKDISDLTKDCLAVIKPKIKTKGLSKKY